MIVLSNAETVVAIYGVGLIGSAVRRAIVGRTAWRELFYPVRWNDPRQLVLDLQTVSRVLLDQVLAGRGRVCIVWSAGVCGFRSRKAETQPELESFKQGLESFRVLSRVSDARLELILMSSLGGLFESHRGVHEITLPAPCRPYGWLKLHQENALGELDLPVAKHIYRVSSAYGRVRNGHRLGLVSTLIHNGIHRRVTPIVGRTTALRDFVFADDIGESLATLIAAGPGRVMRPEMPAVLALGKPASIFEIRSMVERVLGRRVLIAFQSHSENDGDITVSRQILAKGWQPQGLGHGLRCVYEDYLSQGTTLIRPRVGG